MDPALGTLLSPSLLTGLGIFTMAGAMMLTFYWLSATGRLFTRSQHEGEIRAITKAHDIAMEVVQSQHATTLEHFTKRNDKLESLFETQQEVIKSQQLVNASKHEVIAQQSEQIELLLEVAATVDDFLKRTPRKEVPGNE